MNFVKVEVKKKFFTPEDQAFNKHINSNFISKDYSNFLEKKANSNRAFSKPSYIFKKEFIVDNVKKNYLNIKNEISIKKEFDWRKFTPKDYTKIKNKLKKIENLSFKLNNNSTYEIEKIKKVPLSVNYYSELYNKKELFHHNYKKAKILNKEYAIRENLSIFKPQKEINFKNNLLCSKSYYPNKFDSFNYNSPFSVDEKKYDLLDKRLFLKSKKSLTKFFSIKNKERLKIKNDPNYISRKSIEISD